MRAIPALLLVLLLVPGWSGNERLALPTGPIRMAAERVALDPADPARTRLGRLSYLGGAALTGSDGAFGSFSAMLVRGDRFTLVSDAGAMLRFRMGDDWRPRDASLDPLPAGPATGWEKSDRDAESVTTDPRTGRVWIGFENHHEIWRYAPGLARAERFRAVPAMARWPHAGGAEAMVRLADGRFVVIPEWKRPPRRRGDVWPDGREALVFSGDPTDPANRPRRFVYRAARAHDPVDMAELPDGRLLVLERGFDLPFRWYNRLAIVERGAVRPGALVTGREVARLAAPSIRDNFEGLAVAREGGATIVWLLSDDNQFPLQRTLLLKFRLDA